jgi:hypothetical protein
MISLRLCRSKWDNELLSITPTPNPRPPPPNPSNAQPQGLHVQVGAWHKTVCGSWGGLLEPTDEALEVKEVDEL